MRSHDDAHDNKKMRVQILPLIYIIVQEHVYHFLQPTKLVNMRVLLLFIALLHVSQASKWTERSLSWNRFKLVHNKHYLTSREEQDR